MNSIEKPAVFAVESDMVEKFPEVSIEQLQRPGQIKDSAAEARKAVPFFSALVSFVRDNADASDYLAFHLGSGSGLTLDDLKTRKGFDYPDGRFMAFLENWYKENIE